MFQHWEYRITSPAAIRVALAESAPRELVTLARVTLQNCSTISVGHGTFEYRVRKLGDDPLPHGIVVMSFFGDLEAIALIAAARA